MCNRRRLLRQKAGGACLYMPQDGHWQPILKSTTPPKVGSSAAKQMEIANSLITHWKPLFPIQNFRPKWHFLAKILLRRFWLSRTTSYPSRLIRPRLIDCDRGRHRQMKTDGFVPISLLQHRQKVSSADLHPQKKPTAKVSNLKLTSKNKTPFWPEILD